MDKWIKSIWVLSRGPYIWKLCPQGLSPRPTWAESKWKPHNMDWTWTINKDCEGSHSCGSYRQWSYV